MRRREFIAGVGSAAALPLVAGAHQPDRVRRIGVLMPYDENDPESTRRVSTFTQALVDLGWTDGRKVRVDLRFGIDPIGCERSRRSWSACRPTSS
jgi:putative tryptophan/tyrosine transport system substrate-binding protein